jgi:hypothetical protein
LGAALVDVMRAIAHAANCAMIANVGTIHRPSGERTV